MKPMNRKIAAITLTTLLFASAGAALAFGGHRDHGACDRDGDPDGYRGPMAALMQLEELSAKQREELQEIGRATRDAMRELRNEMQDNRANLQDAMVDNADLETIRDLAQKQGDQVARMIVLRAEVRNKISSLLTEKQRQQLQDLRWSDRGFGKHSKGF
jgi:Spy/CpxP family protein refolding chaperone